jgi:hypothetical protein
MYMESLYAKITKLNLESILNLHSTPVFLNCSIDPNLSRNDFKMLQLLFYMKLYSNLNLTYLNFLKPNILISIFEDFQHMFYHYCNDFQRYQVFLKFFCFLLNLVKWILDHYVFWKDLYNFLNIKSQEITFFQKLIPLPAYLLNQNHFQMLENFIS